jgi:hypothetical protein
MIKECEMTRKKLPIGIQTFSEIREGTYYYVDKTPLILNMLDNGKYYFLSRPRRFGKSLMLDTIAELFEGNKALFNGLYAENHWDWSKTAPVLRFSFGAGQVRDRQDLDIHIRFLLQQNQQRLTIECDLDVKDHISNCFADLIQKAHQQTGKKVVILIDEYDKPILDNITKPDLAREMREGLRNFYSVIKDNDAHIQFAMLTGVSKFSKVSLFSGLNHMRDITVSSEYSAICGYTDEDVDSVFAPELAGLDRDEIRRWYNGYNWTGTSVYNPFDLLLLFKEREFRNYWFETGTPTFLVDLLSQRHSFMPDFSQYLTSEALLSSFDVDDIATEALMFQAGYLTIRAVQRMGVQQRYIMGYPNREVESSLNEVVLRRYTNTASVAVQQGSRLYELLMINDFKGLEQLFTAFYANIPNDWYRNNPIAQFEGYYASVFYSYFASIGLDIRLEDVTNRGRIDMTVLFNNHIYIIEFKVVETAPEGKAMVQLKARNYAEKYQAHQQPIHLMGVEFSKEAKGLVGFEVESVGT